MAALGTHELAISRATKQSLIPDLQIGYRGTSYERSISYDPEAVRLPSSVSTAVPGTMTPDGTPDADERQEVEETEAPLLRQSACREPNAECGARHAERGAESRGDFANGFECKANG